MKIYFGKITEDFMLEAGGWLEHEGECFAYELTVNDDSVCISDSVGRMVPIGLEDISTLLKAVELADETVLQLEISKAMLANVISL